MQKGSLDGLPFLKEKVFCFYRGLTKKTINKTIYVLGRFVYGLYYTDFKPKVLTNIYKNLSCNCASCFFRIFFYTKCTSLRYFSSEI